MIVIDPISVIANLSDLSKDEKADLLLYLNKNENIKIIDMEDGTFHTRKTLEDNIDSADLRLAISNDIFRESQLNIYHYGYCISVDENNTYQGVLRYQFSTYTHAYKYDGGIDCEFINKYDCIVLNECNEYSVELIQTALTLWTGKRLILVGKSWECVIPVLPDIPGIECIYTEELIYKRDVELIYGYKLLYITYGVPHEEQLDRYHNNVMTYDEIMSFCFMFSDRRALGSLNPDKLFWVMDARYDNLGLFAIYGKAIACARYAKSKGFIPIIRLKNIPNSMYSDYPEDEVWEKFYCQPEGYSVKEVMNSSNVAFSPMFYNGSIQHTMMNEFSDESGVQLSWVNGIYNAKVLETIQEKQKKFLPYPDKTLGVLARGTDYVNTHMKNHAIHASKEMICEKIDEMMVADPELEYIYLATEDADYCKFFKEKYGEKIFFTDQKRYVTNPDEMLSEHHARNTDRQDGFSMGMDYILSINLLSKCKSMVASGSCAGVWRAKEEKEGEYAEFYMFDLGKNS